MMRLGETEQVRARLRGGLRRDLDVVDAADQFLDALAGVRDPEEKRKIIGREFIRTFEAAEVRVFGAAADAGETALPRAGHALPRRRRVRRRRRHLQHQVATTTSAACPTTSSSSSSSRCARSSRTRSASSASSSACPPRWSGASRSPAPASASGSSARSPASGSTSCAQADAIAREELTRAGLDRDIWQMPVVLLADVRSVGVQGDGRTYGHPVVLRPVTSEDAMTADWARLPYDVLERISTRITNEVAEINRVDRSTSPPSRRAPSSGSEPGALTCGNVFRPVLTVLDVDADHRGPMINLARRRGSRDHVTSRSASTLSGAPRRGGGWRVRHGLVQEIAAYRGPAGDQIDQPGRQPTV